ncbi:MAG: hypothetical protein LCH67_02880 [Bacteroidetes bacterium]|jgi:hypothetical protein|nr:hypothetical protein [Bacteroidota bacterium]
MKSKIALLSLIIALGFSSFAADSPIAFGKKRGKKAKSEKCCSEMSKSQCKTEAAKGGAACCAKK